MSMLPGIGGLLIAIAVIALIYWLIMARKTGKIRDIPFRKPSEIAQQGSAAGDAKGLASCEGQVQGQPINAPMSGQPCLYWEIEITRAWEKYSTDSNGNSTTSSGTTSAVTEKGGTIFGLTDGAGTVGVDCTKKPDTDLKDSHSSEVRIGMLLPGELQFGNLRTQVPHLPSGENVKAFRGKEKILPFSQGQTLFALGKVAQGPHGPMLTEMGWSSLMISDKGRDATLGSSVTHAKYAMFTTLGAGGAGAIMLVVGLLVAKVEQPAVQQAASAEGPALSAASATQPPTTAVTPAKTPATTKTPTKK
jgi:hypothetical protein